MCTWEEGYVYDFPSYLSYWSIWNTCSYVALACVSAEASSELCVPWAVYCFSESDCWGNLCKYWRYVCTFSSFLEDAFRSPLALSSVSLKHYDHYVEFFLCLFIIGRIVLEALILTAAVVSALTGYTFWASKKGKDFSFLGPILFTSLIVLLLTSFMQVLSHSFSITFLALRWLFFF